MKYMLTSWVDEAAEVGNGYAFEGRDGPASLEDWEQPPGRSDGPLMAWLRLHDRYDA
jgi:predicted dithiol-disulfide oxidoreductase (DUF899 family)